MDFLFLDNFRGFEETLLPLAQVNFLVGENSTGKSSVLGLVHTLGHHEFWLNQSLDTEEFEFGPFDDIVSIGSSDRTYFQVGLIEHDEETRSCPKAFLFTFKQTEGRPVARRFHLLTEGAVVELRLQRNQVVFRTRESGAHSWDGHKCPKFFRAWMTDQRSSSAGFKKVPEEAIGLPIAPLAFELLKRQRGAGRTRRASFVPAILPDVTPDAWLAPIRSRPRRTYDGAPPSFSPEGEHTPYLIRTILRSSKGKKWLKRRVAKFGRESGLFRTLGVHSFGRGWTAPFSVRVDVGGHRMGLNSVGYGVSQAMPILVEILARPRESRFAIQQPEVHLHPRAQAAFGDVMFETAMRESKCFLVETHSDYLIDRFRYRIGTADRKKSVATQVIFFERMRGKNIATCLPLDSHGDFAIDPPPSYRRFFLREQMRVLGID